MNKIDEIPSFRLFTKNSYHKTLSKTNIQSLRIRVYYFVNTKAYGIEYPNRHGKSFFHHHFISIILDDPTNILRLTGKYTINDHNVSDIQ